MSGRITLDLLALGNNYTCPFINVAKLTPDLFLQVSGVGYHNNTGFGNSPWGLYVDANGQPNASIPGCTEIAIQFFTPEAGLSAPPAGFNRTGQSWVATWDGDAGTATVDQASAQTQVGSRVNWTWGPNDQAYNLTLTGFSTSNCPRNFRVFLASSETAFNAGEIFDPDYCKQINLGSGRLRFMQWQQSIGGIPPVISMNTTYASIPTEGFYSWLAPNSIQGINGGLPVSLMYKLCNKLSKHPHVCFPYMLGNGKSAIVSGATNANPCVITATGHPFVNGDLVTFIDVPGMTQINFPTSAFTVASATTNTFALSGVDSTAYGVYTAASTCTACSPYSLSGITSEAAQVAAAMRDNLNGGLYTCFEFNNEVWNDTTMVWHWVRAQNQIYGGAGLPQNRFWGYIAAHYMRVVYDTYGAANRSKWKGILGSFLADSGVTTDILIGVNAYLTANPSYTMANLFDELSITGYFGSHTFQGNSTDFNPATVTISNGAPGVVTFPGGVLGSVPTKSPIKLTTTGTLPSPLVVGTVYWIIGISGNTCNLAATQGGAAINTTTNGSGVHTATDCQGDISLDWINTSIFKFNSTAEPTRYSWFNKQVNINNSDGSLTGAFALVDCITGIQSQWTAHQTIATANGLGLSQYEGGNSALLYGFGAFVSTGVTLTLANPCVLTMGSGNAPAVGTPVTFVTTGTLPSSLTGGSSGLVYYVINPSGNTCNISATVGGSAISTASQSQSGSHTMQGAYAEFWPHSFDTAEDATNNTTMFNNFVGIGGIFPSKYGDVGVIVPGNPGFPWGALQFLGAAVNDDTPLWDAIVLWNNVALPPSVPNPQHGHKGHIHSNIDWVLLH